MSDKWYIAGPLGIGTTQPSAKLHVEGGDEPLKVANNGYFFFVGANRAGGDYVDIGAIKNNGTAWANLVLNRDGGNVGIGTTEPVSRLHVADGNSALKFYNLHDITVLSAENSTAAGTTVLNLQKPAKAWQLRIDGSDGDKFKIYDATKIADRLTIDGSGNVGIGTDPVSGKLQFDNSLGNKVVVYDNGPTDRYGFGLNDSNLNAFVPAGGRFSIRQNGYDGTEVMTVTGGGNVGIGTTTPGAKLEIKGGDVLLKAAAEDAGDIIFQNSSGTQKGRIWSEPAAGGGLHFSSGDNTPDININASGNVGIGILAPIAKLDVGGTFRLGENGSIFSNIRGGRAQIGPHGEGVPFFSQIGFGVPFPSPPSVIVTVRAQGNRSDIFAVVTSEITNEGFRAYIRRLDSGLSNAWAQNLELDWFAWESGSPISSTPQAPNSPDGSEPTDQTEPADPPERIGGHIHGRDPREVP